MKRRLLLYFACGMMLFSACGNSSADPEHKDSSTIKTTRLSDKLVAIAAALPLTKDSAHVFLSTLFAPADSLQVTVDKDFKHFNGKGLHLVLNNTEKVINEVTVWPASGTSIPVPLGELGAKMDSAWQTPPAGLIPVKEPLPEVIAYYTDPQHRKKKFLVLGPDHSNLAKDPEIRVITISVDE